MKIAGPGSMLACLAAAVLVAAGMFSPASAAPAPSDHKRVDVSVSVVGNLEGIDAGEVEDLAEHLLEAGHVAVTDDDGPDVIELHIVIAIDDDQQGFAMHFEAGAWKDDADLDDLDNLDDVLKGELTEFEATIDDDDE